MNRILRTPATGFSTEIIFSKRKYYKTEVINKFM